MNIENTRIDLVGYECIGPLLPVEFGKQWRSVLSLDVKAEPIAQPHAAQDRANDVSSVDLMKQVRGLDQCAAVAMASFHSEFAVLDRAGIKSLGQGEADLHCVRSVLLQTRPTVGCSEAHP